MNRSAPETDTQVNEKTSDVSPEYTEYSDVSPEYPNGMDKLADVRGREGAVRLFGGRNPEEYGREHTAPRAGYAGQMTAEEA